MFLVVAGDIDFARAKKLVQEYFADIPTYKVAKFIEKKKKNFHKKAPRLSVERLSSNNPFSLHWIQNSLR